MEPLSRQFPALRSLSAEGPSRIPGLRLREHNSHLGLEHIPRGIEIFETCVSRAGLSDTPGLTSYYSYYSHSLDRLDFGLLKTPALLLWLWR